VTEQSAGPPDTGLPVETVVGELRAALAARGSAVLTAEPGAGKTTVVPLRLLAEPWLGDRRIVMLEPRRIATRAAAARMASLLGDDVGGIVGYRTRDDRRVSGRTRIEVVTEGILTRRIQNDPELSGVGAVIFDEFHERNLVADLGLALTLDVRASLRPDLRLLVMSATIDTAGIAALVGGGGEPVPVIEAAGRTHPVDITYRPRGRRDHLEPAVARAVTEALGSEGDVLVFLPGAGEIRRSAEALSELPTDVDVRPLFGGLSAAEQDAAVAPSPVGRRKVVLATDIAETSLTVEGVTAVVDAGMSREPRFDARSGMTRLVTVAASRDSADQRAGRAGRTRPGVALRLWSKMEHGTRPRRRSPEITQVDLCGFVLETAAWGVADLTTLALLDPPPSRALDEARQLLAELGALDAEGRPTDLGRAMTGIGVHPRLARMILDAIPSGDGALACMLAALLDDRDILRGRPDDLPVDLAERVRLLVDRGRRHRALDVGALHRARDRAVDLARRASVTDDDVDATHTGRVLALAYPDRVAARRPTGVGRFVTVGGGGAWIAEGDPLAVEGFVVAADLDGKRRDARIRLAAGLDNDDLLADFGDRIDERTILMWDDGRDELTERVERRLGEIALDVVVRRPEPSPDVTAELVARVRRDGLEVLGWTDRSRRIRSRAQFCRRHGVGDWPDLSDEDLLDSLEGWLVPHLEGVATWARLRRVDLSTVLMTLIGWHRRRELDRLAPETVAVPSGRNVAIDYDADPPAVAVRVQEMFGATETPTVADGAVPLTLHLLSPADRPVQITSDIAGFWAGSWAEVRKDMAGRYPKHAWPEDPTDVDPHRGPRRRR
jgi:ATP-dependent helicase HrpB